MLVEELTPPPDPEAAFTALSPQPHCVFFDSAQRHAELGRYSFLTADPFAYLEVPADGSDALARLDAMLSPYRTETIVELPPFQGGAAGMLGYDLGRSLERVPTPRYDEFGIPALAVGLYDVVLAWDHRLGRAWLASQGFPEQEAGKRKQRATARMQQFRAWLDGAGSLFRRPRDLELPESSAAKKTPDPFAPQFPVGDVPELTSNFSREAYLAAVRRAIHYIYAGDVFQVNLAQRLLHPDDGDPVALYGRLRQRNPATFAGYFAGRDFQITSASPERFVQLRDRKVETRPIKGTRHRSRWPESDLFTGDELRASEKDRAENVMIVDLLRNDLSRVCTPQSVRVTQLCDVEVFETVQHLVSVVEGELQAGRTPIDLLRAAFPGGSITGAPKVRAMEIIAELEPTARGAYCGSLGYIGFDGAMDWNILIRTMTIAGGWRQFPVGGGIVAQSDPVAEYEETWHKAAGMLRALSE